MIRLAHDFSHPEGVPEDYLIKYVNGRIIEAIAVIIDDAIEMTTMPGDELREIRQYKVSDNYINILTDDIPNMLAIVEYKERTEYDENFLMPASVPNNIESMEAWIRPVFNELIATINDKENVSTPSLEGEYLLSHILMATAALFGDEPELEEMIVKKPPTNEILKIAEHYAFQMKEEFRDEFENEDVDTEEWLEGKIDEAISDMTDIRRYVGMEQTDHPLLIWDDDYELLDSTREISKSLKDAAKIATNKDVYWEED